MRPWPGDANLETTTFAGLSRAELMSRIRSTGNRTTELNLAALLRRSQLAGWRRHLNLLGKPDFAWPKERLAVFVDGCFWHGHGCHRNLRPRKNASAWRAKILKNGRRDRRNSARLRAAGWTVIRIWECGLSSDAARCVSRIARALRTLAGRVGQAVPGTTHSKG